MKRKIIILTKSDKHTGYCIAGIDYNSGEWIRLLSDNVETEGAVPEEQLYYHGGGYLQVYDIVECNLERTVASSVQPENWLYNTNECWKKVGISNKHEVLRIHGFDSPKYIFKDTANSLASDTIFSGEPSLLLLNINQASYFIKTFPEGRRRVQLNFTYNGNQYSYFKITQKEIKDGFMQKPDGNYSIIQSSAIVFSLTDRYERSGRYYKVVAQILN